MNGTSTGDIIIPFVLGAYCLSYIVDTLQCVCVVLLYGLVLCFVLSRSTTRMPRGDCYLQMPSAMPIPSLPAPSSMWPRSLVPLTWHWALEQRVFSRTHNCYGNSCIRYYYSLAHGWGSTVGWCSVGMNNVIGAIIMSNLGYSSPTSIMG